MKRFITLLMMVLLAGFAMAQTPQKLSYQAVVRNSANQLVANQPVTVTVDITDAAGSTNYYSETHSVTTNPNGLISLMVGEGSPVSGKMSDVIWWDAAIKTTIDVTGTKIENTTLVTAVPYALHADSARTVNREVLNEQIHEITDEAIGNLNIRITRTNVRVDSIGKKLTDTLKYYVSAQALADTANSIRIWVIGTIHDSLEVIRSEYSNITDIINNLSDRVDEFNIHVCDSVAACLNTSSDLQDALNQFLSEHHFLTSDSTLITNMLTDITNLQTNVTNLENKLNDFKVNVCDSVAKCIGGDNAITDAITNVTENYLSTNNFLTKDSTTIINIQKDITNLEGRVNEFNINVCDSVAKCIGGDNNITNAITNVTENYLTENNFMTKDSLAKNNFLTKDSTTIINIQNDITNMQNDITNLQERVDKFNINVCDSVAKCIGGDNAITNAITNVTNEYLTENNYITKDSLVKNSYLTKDSTTAINNIINNYLTDNEYITADALADSNYAKKSDLPTVNDATLFIQRNGVEVGVFTANQSTDVDVDILVPTKVTDLDDADQYVTKTYLDTNNYMTKDSLVKNNYLTKDSTTIINIQNDITKLEERVNEFNIHVCDSVAACLTPGTAIADSIDSVVKEYLITNNYMTKDSLITNNYLTKDSTTIINIQNDLTKLEERVNEFNIHVCDSVAACLTPGTAIADSIDSVVKEYLITNNYMTKDSLITNNYLTKDSTTIINMQNDITNLEQRVDKFNLHVCDSVAACLTPGSAIADSIDSVVKEYLITNNYMTKDSLITNNYLTKDSTTIINMQTDITNLEKRVNEFNLNVCDSVAACLTTESDIKDSIIKIVNNYLTDQEYITGDALADSNYAKKTDINDGTLTVKLGTSTVLGTFTANQSGETTITIPEAVAANDGTLTIQRNGTDVGTFTANQSSDVDIDILVPTKVTDLTDADQYVTKTYLDTNNYMTKDSLIKNNFLTSDSTIIINNIINDYLNANDYITEDDLSAYATLAKVKADSLVLANVQADWNVTDNTSDAFIKNKPSIKDSVDKVLTDNHYVTEGDVATYLTTNKYIKEQALIDSNYVKTTELPTEQSAKFSATAGQTAFTITSTPNAKYLVKFYINGILVGDNNTGVVTVSGTTVTYVPAQNEDYALEAGDKILIYWFK